MQQILHFRVVINWYLYIYWYKDENHDKLSINPLPNDKILDLTKLKAFADNKLNVAKIIIFLYDRAENTVGKGENAGY